MINMSKIRINIFVVAAFVLLESTINAQSTAKEWPIQQPDSRITVKIKYGPGLDFDEINGWITNNTSDTLHVNYECTVTGKSGKVQTLIGGIGSSYYGLPSEMRSKGSDINPGQTVGGFYQSFEMQFYGGCKSADKSIAGKLMEGSNCIDDISFRLLSIYNLSEMRRQEAKTKADAKAEKDRIAQAKQEAINKQAAIEEQKQKAADEAKAREEKARQGNESTQQQNDNKTQTYNQQQIVDHQQQDYNRRVADEADRKRVAQENQLRETEKYIKQTQANFKAQMQAVDDTKNKIYALIDAESNRRADEIGREEQEQKDARERQKREAKQKEIEKEERIKRAEKREALLNNRKAVLNNLTEATMPVSSQTKNATSVYFFMYSCDANSLNSDTPELYLSNVFEVAKYADDTWPFIDKVKQKIAQANTGYDYKLSGYYMTKEDAEAKLQLLVNSVYRCGITIKNNIYTYANATTKSKSDSDFWGNKSATNAAPPKQKALKQEATSKVEYDYWGNSIGKKVEQQKTTTATIPKKELNKVKPTPRIEYDDWGNPIKK